MIRVKKFCCCGRIELGGYFVGTFELIHSLHLIIISILILNDFFETYPRIVKSGEEAQEELSPRKYTEVVLGLLITICIANLGTSAMLIYGTYKRLPIYLIPWLVSGAASIVILLMSGFTYYELTYFDVDATIILYWWVCIFSQYKLFKEDAIKASEENTLEIVENRDKPNSDYASINP